MDFFGLEGFLETDVLPVGFAPFWREVVGYEGVEYLFRPIGTWGPSTTRPCEGPPGSPPDGGYQNDTSDSSSVSSSASESSSEIECRNAVSVEEVLEEVVPVSADSSGEVSYSSGEEVLEEVVPVVPVVPVLRLCWEHVCRYL